MTTVTQYDRNRCRTAAALAGEQGLPPVAAAVLPERWAGCSAPELGGMFGIDCAAKPGRAHIGRDDS